MWRGLKGLKQFKNACCSQAKTPDDLRRAGQIGADAIADIGVGGILSVLAIKPVATGIKAVPRAIEGAPPTELGLAKVPPAVPRFPVQTAPNEAFFWSGRSVGPDGARFGGDVDAARIARSQGGTTLETLIKERGISMPEWDPTDANLQAAWKGISEQYANGARGDVHVGLGDELRPDNIWEIREFPALKENPMVNSVTSINPMTGVQQLLWQR